MNKTVQTPFIPASTFLPELTCKVIVLSILLALVLAASNCYLALKIGTTISASIPASVLAIGLLRFFKQSNILECTMIQTAASAGEGVAASISFVLPAMIVLHFWEGFPYWETVSITMTGGILGVLFSIPLRRVLLNIPALKFPEGTAVGKVLETCAKGGASLGLLSYGALSGAVIAFFQSGLQIIADRLPLWFVTNQTVMGVTLGFEPATLAAGYIIGIEVGMSLLTGIVIGWLVILPCFFLVLGVPDSGTAYDMVMDMWSTHLRFVGVGVMFVGGIWTLIRLTKPVIDGLRYSGASSRKTINLKKESTVLRTEQDISMRWVVSGVIFFGALALCLVAYFLQSEQVAAGSLLYFSVLFLTVLIILAMGFVLSTVCGYFTGLIGSSNNPLSGILIIAVILVGVVFICLFGHQLEMYKKEVTAFLVLVVSVIATSASISNENIQDLKAGQMIGATPWKQQLILMLGVVVSAFILAPILELLFQAYGMGGVFPHEGMPTSQMLPAPQAGLIGAVAQGVITQHLPWNTIGIGFVIAVLLIGVDEYLKPKGKRLPVLAVGLGIYLPMEVLMPVVLGSVVSYLVSRKRDRKYGLKMIAKSHGHDSVLLACGVVAGAALMGVILAVPFVLMGGSDALRVMPASLDPLAGVLGVLAMLALCWWLYRTAVKQFDS